MKSEAGRMKSLAGEPTRKAVILMLEPIPNSANSHRGAGRPLPQTESPP